VLNFEQDFGPNLGALGSRMIVQVATGEFFNSHGVEAPVSGSALPHFWNGQHPPRALPSIVHQQGEGGAASGEWEVGNGT
jgi:hypothetical protein